MAEKKRSLAKAFSWRIFASCITLAIVWIITGDLKVGSIIGLADFVIKLLAYYGHERIWANVQWGRDEPTTPSQPLA